jgi:hypothetical protein
MRRCRIVVDRVRIDTRHDVHAKPPRAFHECAERVAIPEIAAGVME